MYFSKNSITCVTVLALMLPLAAYAQKEVMDGKKQEAEVIIIEESIDRDGNRTIHKTIRKDAFTDEELDEIVRLETDNERESPEQGIKNERGYLGVMIENAPNGNGARVTGVVEGSPAEIAGLQEGDIITKVEEEEIKTTSGLVKAVGGYGPGETVLLGYLRDGENEEVEVVLSRRSDHEKTFEIVNEEEFFPKEKPKAEPPKRHLGVYLKKADLGVRINEVTEGSVASGVGLQAGDVITTFDGKTVKTSEELIDAIQSAEAGKKIEVKFLRDGEEHTKEVKFDF